MKDSIDRIYKIQRELSNFGGIAALLGWDQKTYMPIGGNMERSNQLSLISRLAHEKFISDELFNHVNKLSKSYNLEKLEERDKIVVLRFKKDIEKARKVPPEFVEKMSKTTALAYTAWEEARKKAEFSLFSPHLEKIIELEKEYCGYIDLPGHPYNSLLDGYEEGMTIDKLKSDFNHLKKQLSVILQRITSTETYKKQKKFGKKFDVEKQKEICSIIIKKMNLPGDKSRLDVSTHPFTVSIGYDDVRITTNYERKDPLFSFFSTVHEAGHALYELGLPREEFKDTVISDAPSLGLHESQSRFWENIVARSENFWNFLFPIFQKTFPEQFKNLDCGAWLKIINQVEPSLIRVEADELTYCLHVILRFELELDLIDGQIKISELPRLWNEKMKEMLGIGPKNDREGILQDMHWSTGDFGYFPTYVIGTIYASQLFKQLLIENPNVFNEIEKGNFTNILNWLTEHVHKHGRKKSAEEIIKKTCGEGLNSKIFVNYLKNKYYHLYDV